MKKEIELTFNRDTKNTYVYEAPLTFGVTDKDAIITNLYLQKSAIGNKPPEKIKVTVESF